MLRPQHAVLLVIDVQGNLAERMHEKDVLFQNLKIAIRAAQILDIPIICTEQAPEKLGPTNPQLAQLLGQLKPIPKKTFSCYKTEQFRAELKRLRRKNVIVCGIESHVCVYQTVADLLAAKYRVHVIVDAVSSRILQNKWVGLERMKALGAQLTSCEMLATELIQSADHPQFKEILTLIK